MYPICLQTLGKDPLLQGESVKNKKKKGVITRAHADSDVWVGKERELACLSAYFHCSS